MKHFLTTVTIMLLALTVNAQDSLVVGKTDTVQTLKKRPKVGVVLSGGGAKGFAHIGALKVIEEAGIPIDYIAGTSMGSIVGGLYAVGYDPDMMKKLCTEQDWDKIIKDQIPRKFLPLEKRINERHYIITVPCKKGKLKIKRSIVDGMYVNMLLTRLTLPAYKNRDFESLPVPFLCIGTDMLSADAIEFNKGSLAQSIRSSMSIPFLFEPVSYDGYLLCDGGLTNNFPVRNVREHGADIIIGVDLEIIKSDPEVLDNSLKVLERLIAVVSQDESNKAREECDILIRPDIGKANIMSFNDFDPIMKCGEEGARAKFPELKRLADSLQALGPFEVERHHTQPIDSITLAGVEVEGVDEYQAGILKSEFGSEFPHTFAVDEIETILIKIYSQGYYSNVWYEVIDRPEGDILILHSKTTTSLTFSLGLHYDNNYGVGTLLNMNARTKHFTYNVDLNISDNPYVKARATHRYTKLLSGSAELAAIGIMSNLYSADGKIVAPFKLQTNYLDLYLQLAPSVTQAFRLGIRADYFVMKDLKYVSDQDLEYEDEYRFSPKVYLNYFFNNEDQTDFPRRGWNVNLQANCIPYNGYYDENFEYPMFSVQADIRKSFSIGKRHAFRIGGVWTQRLGDTPLNDVDMYMYGGQSKMRYLNNLISFTGLPFQAVYTEFGAYAKTAWQYNFYKNFYAIASCNAGYFKNYLDIYRKNMSFDDIINLLHNLGENSFDTWFVSDNFIMGAGLTIGIKTMFGPIEMQVSKSNKVDMWNLFVNVGFWF